MRARKTWIGLFAALVIVVPALPAHACSCAYGDPRERLAEADGAFIGTLVSQTETEPPDPDEPISSGRDNTYTFTVEEVFKGDIGETIEVHAPADGASCGLEMGIGQQDGLFLYMEDGLWRSSLCSRVNPQELRDAAAPLPEPDGQNPARFLIGGSYGEARILAVDEQGRTIAYGYGQKDTTHVNVCPGSRFSVEAVDTRRKPSELAVRDLETFEVVRNIEIAGWNNWYSGKKPDLVALLCLTEDASDILAFGSTRHEPVAHSELLRITPDGITEVHDGTGMSATLTPDAVYVNQGRWGKTVAVIDPSTGAETKVTKLYEFAKPHPSPDGEWIATYYNDWREMKAPSRITLTSADGSEQRSARLFKGGRIAQAELLWVDNDTLAFLPWGGDIGTAKVFDLNLDVTSTFDWYARSNVALGSDVFGLEFESLVRTDLSSTEKVADLLFPVVGALALIPDGATIEP